MNYARSSQAFALATERDIDVVRPDARARAILWLTLAYWGLNVAVFTLAQWLQEQPRLAEMVGMRILLAAFGIALCFGIQLVLRRLKRRALWKRVAALMLMVPVAAETYAWASYFGVTWVNGEPISLAIQWGRAVTIMATWSWFFIGWAGLSMAVEYAFDAREEELRASQFQALAQTAKLHALHNQINPHFLFNSLNSISALIGDRRLDDADRMVDLLASYLRKTLAIDPSMEVRLIDEIGLQLEYLAIEQARYPDLVVEVDVPEDLEDVKAPALLLQPLVENAVKHGVAGAAPPAKIAIRARREGGDVAITVENTAPQQAQGARTAGAGIGLRNVRERLRHRYPDRQRLSVGPLSEGGYAAVVHLPLAATP